MTNIDFFIKFVSSLCSIISFVHAEDVTMVEMTDLMVELFDFLWKGVNGDEHFYEAGEAREIW